MQCRRCGRCCYVHLIAYVTEEDLRRWQQEGRRDILTVLERGHVAWAGDRILSMDRGFFSHVCPFLTVEWGKCSCSIYETRPQICREYQPGSSELCPLWVSNDKGEKE